MRASGSRLEEKKNQPNEVKDVMPTNLWSLSQSTGIINLIGNYAWETPLHKPTLFSGVDQSLDKIKYLVEHAGPLDAFEFFVRRLITLEKANRAETYVLIDHEEFVIGGRKGPLIAIILIGLDQGFRNMSPRAVTHYGMAECFIKIIADLLPSEKVKKVIAQARKAMPFVEEKAQAQREAANFHALNKVYIALKRGNEEAILHEIQIFNHFLQEIKQCSMNKEGHLIDNRYYLNILHLIYATFEMMVRRSLSAFHGLPADNRFCTEILGNMLESALPARPRQILKSGLRSFLQNSIDARRIIDAHSLDFLLVKDHAVGVDSFYDDTGLKQQINLLDPMQTANQFHFYYEQLRWYTNLLHKPLENEPDKLLENLNLKNQYRKEQFLQYASAIGLARDDIRTQLLEQHYMANELELSTLSTGRIVLNINRGNNGNNVSLFRQETLMEETAKSELLHELVWEKEQSRLDQCLIS